MNTEIASYLDSLEEEVRNTQILFFEGFNQKIRKQLNLVSSFRIEKYIDPFGGFLLDAGSYAQMDARLIDFYDHRIKKNEQYHLRGYDYYQADPLVHLRSEKYSCNDLWSALEKKWKDYSRVRSFDFLYEKPSLENWIGSLGILEYLFEDLTVIRWFLFRNRKMLTDVFSEKYEVIVEKIEHFSEVAAESIACLLNFDFKRMKDLCGLYCEFLSSDLLLDFLKRDYEGIDKASMRTIREGDSLIKIYAAYCMKLRPACEKNKWKNIELISNAFGAMNIGLILKYLIAPVCTAEHTNIRYAQHRSPTDLI